MHLYTKFVKIFLQPYIFGILFSMILITVILNKVTFNKMNEQTEEDIMKIEKQYSDVNLNSISLLILNDLLKLQIGFQQLIKFYSNIAELIRTKAIEKVDLVEYTYNYYDLRYNNPNNNNFSAYYSSWFVDQYTTKANLTNTSTNLYHQISIFSNLIHTVYSFYLSTSDILLSIYLYFEDTNLLINYPVNNGTSFDYAKNPSYCTDKNGNIYDIFNFKCTEMYEYIAKTEKEIFDLNNGNQIDRKIFVLNLNSNKNSYEDGNLTICLKFNDSISYKNAYVCGDINNTKLFDIFDFFNQRLRGFFIIASVGYYKMFYYPKSESSRMTKISELFYGWDKNFYLQEKLNFINNIEKKLTSNYIFKINATEIHNEPIKLFKEIFINDTNNTKSDKNQYFYADNKKYFYNIFPIILENDDKNYEHILSVIYFYTKEMYFNHLNDYQINYLNQTIIQLIIVIAISSIIIYLLILTFKTLAYYIVVPIKNIFNMIKGINLGGLNRLDYLKYLQERQNVYYLKLLTCEALANRKNDFNNTTNKEEINTSLNGSLIDESKINNFNSKKNNITLINKITNNDISTKNKSTKEENENIENINITNIGLTNNNDILNYANGNNYIDKISTLNDITDDNKEIINKFIQNEYMNELSNVTTLELEYNKESENLRNELDYYNFNEELLQYRCYEVDELGKALLNFKQSLLLTSHDNTPDKIADYSKSEEIFANYKNYVGMYCCRSNIGNLLSQLINYDKAIYHFALSLDSLKLKKYLEKALVNEYDENNYLLQKIDCSYNKDCVLEYENILVYKQLNNTDNYLSQKLIDVLINERYNKLIMTYYNFFKLIKKSENKYEYLGGLFMHTHYHTINYYHKILIQYIFLCYKSNDLIKIGESILDYIEFLIKFKLNTSKENKNILKLKINSENMSRKEYEYYQEKQKMKKFSFDKILNWFNLFDNYIEHVTKKTNITSNYNNTDTFSSNSNRGIDNNYINNSMYLFQVNIQRGDFLKGKFALTCKNYRDALFYYLKAAKKKSIVSDGVIRKRSLKHIQKIALKIQKKIIEQKLNSYAINDLFIKSNDFIEYINQSKNEEDLSNISVITNSVISEIEENSSDKNNINKINFIEAIKKIISDINDDIKECNIKQVKDILFIIDINLCPEELLDNIQREVIQILKKNFNQNDKLGLFILDENHYHILCPLMSFDKIDVSNLCTNIYNFIDKALEYVNVERPNKEIFDRMYSKNTNNTDNTQMEKNFGENKNYDKNILMNDGSKANFSNDDAEDEEENEENEENEFSSDYDNEGFREKNVNYEKIFRNIVKNLNFCINYINIKEMDSNNGKYIIFFTDMFNVERKQRNLFKEIFEDIKKDKNIRFLIVGKIKKLITSEKLNKDLIQKQIMINTVLKHFGEKSEFIDMENIKKLKNILSSNNTINDNITFPNELYK